MSKDDLLGILKVIIITSFIISEFAGLFMWFIAYLTGKNL